MNLASNSFDVRKLIRSCGLREVWSCCPRWGNDLKSSFSGIMWKRKSEQRTRVVECCLLNFGLSTKCSPIFVASPVLRSLSRAFFFSSYNSLLSGAVFA